MVRFSPTDAVFAGFRFARERPATILVWAAYLLVVVVVVSISVVDIGGDSLTSLVIALQGSSPDPAKVDKLVQDLAPASLFADLLITVFGSVLATAILRVRLTPGPHPWGGLRLGGDELRMLGATLLVMFCMFGASMATGVIAELVGMVGGPPIVPYIIGFLLVLALQVRLSLVGVIAQAEGRISLPRSIRLTKGMFWRLFGAYVLLAAIVLVILFLLVVIFAALTGAVAMAVGGGVNQMALALEGRFTDLNPVLAALYVVSNLTQVWVIVVSVTVFLNIAADAYKAALIEAG
jgi:hypothetical protein